MGVRFPAIGRTFDSRPSSICGTTTTELNHPRLGETAVEFGDAVGVVVAPLLVGDEVLQNVVVDLRTLEGRFAEAVAFARIVFEPPVGFALFGVDAEDLALEAAVEIALAHGHGFDLRLEVFIFAVIEHGALLWEAPFQAFKGAVLLRTPAKGDARLRDEHGFARIHRHVQKIGFLALGVLFPFVADFGAVVTEGAKARADRAVKLGAKGLPLFGDAPREQSLDLNVDVLRQVAFEPLDVDAIRGRPHTRRAGEQEKTDDGRPRLCENPNRTSTLSARDLLPMPF